MTLSQLKKSLRAAALPGDADYLGLFFKTGPGQYAEGDKFLGVRVPAIRALLKETDDLFEDDILHLVRSPFHEERALGLFIWVRRFSRGDEMTRRAIHRQYLRETAFINNWDLVDNSAPDIVGKWLLEHPVEQKILSRLARSSSLWERRIAMLATFPFIRAEEFSRPLEIAELLLHDSHDLIHKAVGWMLREIGQRDLGPLRRFLMLHAPVMPRTMLRYAIEKMDQKERRQWMTARSTP